MVPKDTIDKAYQALATGDVPTVLGMLDDKVEWTQANGSPYAGTYHGPQAVLEGVFARLGAEWDVFKIEPSQHVAEGDEVVSLGTYSGTYKATGKSFSARFAHAFTVKDGKIVRFEQVVDSAELNKAL
ncbi:MAG: nuclear transport factor 2 family protein [Pseudonocardiaceae bacterium]